MIEGALVGVPSSKNPIVRQTEEDGVAPLYPRRGQGRHARLTGALEASPLQNLSELESLKGKRCCKQVKFYPGVCALAARRFCLSRILKAGPGPWSYQILKKVTFAGTRQ